MKMSKTTNFVKMLSCIMTFAMVFSIPAFAADAMVNTATKLDYYTQYQSIVEEVSKNTELDITLLPMEEFSDEDWKTPDEFRQFITDVANWNLTCTDSSSMSRSSGSATKSVTVDADGHNYTISITGSFTTQYSSVHKCQVMSGITSISSKISGSTGTWTQTGYERSLIDGGRTYAITVSGTLKIGGATFSNKLAYCEFYCNAQGAIS